MFQEFWAFMPVRGTSMKKANLAILYALGTMLSPLGAVQFTMDGTVDRDQISQQAFLLHKTLAVVLNEYSALETSDKAGRELLGLVDEMQKWYITTPPNERYKPDKAVDYRFKQLVTKAETFEVALLEELRGFMAYIPSQKNAYSTRILVERADESLPPLVLNKMTKGIRKEIGESGKCLVFDLPTAAGFHILRALELVIHEYYLVVCEPPDRKPLDNWGAYISELRKHDIGDISVKEAIALIQQVKDNDRNLIMHPERVLSSDDSLVLFDIAKAAMSKMAEKLPIIQRTD